MSDHQNHSEPGSSSTVDLCMYAGWENESAVTDSFVSLIFGGGFLFVFLICSSSSHVKRSKLVMSKSLNPYDIIVVLQTMSKSFKIQKKTHRKKKKSLLLAFYRSQISYVASSL